MVYKEYTQEEQDAYVELAQEVGFAQASRELGYPACWSTGHRWAEARGVTISIDTMKRKAALLNIFYGDKERLLATQTAIERIVSMLEDKRDLSAEDVNKLVNALQRAMQTMALIEGKATNRSETISKDATDVELAELINEARAANAAVIQDITKESIEEG